MATSGQVGNLRDFIASHFCEMKKETLDDLDLETAQLLMSSSALTIRDEDSLYDFVISRSEHDARFVSLFEFIYFEYLSVDRMKHFTSFVSENLLQNIHSGIWARICRRLIIETKLKGNPRVCTAPEIEVVYEGKPLNGIIAHLTRECGGNVYDNEIVNITASSCQSDYHPKNAADFSTDSAFDSEGLASSWICYDFKDRSVIPTSYSVRSWARGPGSCHLKSWVIEVSNDGSSWTEIDRRDNNHDLNNRTVTQNFKVLQVP